MDHQKKFRSERNVLLLSAILTSMKLSFLQLNINADNYWNLLTPFLAKNDFDIINLQETTGNGTICGNVNSKRDVFDELTKLLNSRYNGEQAIAQRFASSPTAYMGNATFYKKSFTLHEKKIITLVNNPTALPADLTDFGITGRNLLHLTLNREGKSFSVLNMHGAWAPKSTEHPHQTAQGKLLTNYLETVPAPFIFSGDLNLNPQQPLIHTLSSLARNLISEHTVDTTLNPRLHSAKVLFPPGVVVDYIFVSKDIEVNSFAVLEEDLSDHLALTATLTV